MAERPANGASVRASERPRLSLAKRDKLTLRSEFAQVKASGRKAAGPLLAVGFAPADDGQVRAGVVCGKKYSLLAVTRNRARRLVWESFRQLKPAIAPCRLVFIPRRRMQSAKCPAVTAEMQRHLITLEVWRNAPRAPSASSPASSGATRS